MSQNLNRFFRIYLRLAALTLVVCTLLRIVLLFNEQTSELGFGFLQWVAVFGLGALNDLSEASRLAMLNIEMTKARNKEVKDSIASLEALATQAKSLSDREQSLISAFKV